MKKHRLTISITNKSNPIKQVYHEGSYWVKTWALLVSWYERRFLRELVADGIINVHTELMPFEQPLIKKKVIYNHEGEPYLIRRSLINTKWLSVKIHNILLSDPACLHDHPWTFISFLLKGSYIEHTANGSKRYGPLRLLYRPAKYAHRLEVAKPVWSIVVTFKKVRQWGFITPSGWVEWFKYQRAESCD